MSAIPFSDIGKAAKDLLSKDYPIGSAKLELSTTSSNGLKVTVTGDKDNKSGAILADLKFKYSCKERGFTLTKTFKTSNSITGQVEFSDCFTKGLKLDIESCVSDKCAKNLKLGAEYKNCFMFLRSNVDVFKGPPSISTDVVFAKNGFLVGGDYGYCLNACKLDKYDSAAAYVNSDYTVAVKVLKKCSAWETSYYRKVSPDADIVAKVGGNLKTMSDMTLELGAKYALDQDSFVKFKTNSVGHLGLGYTQTLRPGFKLAVGGLFDTTRLSENAHKLGVSLTIEA